MSDIISNIIFFDPNEYILNPINSSFKLIITSPPLVLDSLDNIVGISVQIDYLRYKIYYSTNYYGNIKIRILEKSILVNQPTKITNSLILDATTIRNMPEYIFFIPNNTENIDFETGIYIKINIINGILDNIPLYLDNTIPSTVITSSMLYYDDTLKTIRFYPEEEKTYNNEWVKIIPDDIPSSLNQTYILGYNLDTISYNIEPLFLKLKTPGNTKIDSYNYTVNNPFFAPFDMINYKVSTLTVYSSTYTPSFILNNYTNYFTIDFSSGVITTISNTIPQEINYQLQITVSNTNGESINVIINVFVYDILSDSYYRRLLGNNFCKPGRNIRMQVYPCISPTDTVYNHVTYTNISNLRYVLDIIIRIINCIFYHVFTPDFRIISDLYDIISPDTRSLGKIFITENEDKYKDFLKSKITSLNQSSLLSLKIESFSRLTYPFFLKIFKSYAINDYKCSSHNLSMEYGHIIIN